MWPWEHLAVGYLAYSVLVRLIDGRAPAAAGAVAVALGTQFPDLVDKPLGWGTTLLPSGQSLGHSLFVAIPVVGIVLATGMITGRRWTAAAFGVGYLSHLPGDVVYPVFLGGELNFGFLFWPVVAADGGVPTAILAHVGELFARFAETLMTPTGVAYLLFEVVLLAGALVLWIQDGTPGLRWPENGPKGEIG